MSVTAYKHWAEYKQTLANSLGLPTAPLPDELDKSRLATLEVQERALPGWNESRVLERLGVTKKAYDMALDTGVHGYFNHNTHELTVTRATSYPTRILWHELAHYMLDHSNRYDYSDTSQRAICEAEAECAAYLLATHYKYGESRLESRSYIQHWASAGASDTLKRLDFHRIYTTVDLIIEASK